VAILNMVISKTTNMHLKIAMWHCCFRLLLSSKSPLLRSPWSKLLKSTLYFVTKKYFFRRVLFTFYSSSFPAKYFLLVLRYFFQVLFYFVTKYWNKVTTPALSVSNLTKGCQVNMYKSDLYWGKHQFTLFIPYAQQAYTSSELWSFSCYASLSE